MVFDTYKMSAARSRTDDMLIVMIDIRHLLGRSLNVILVPPYLSADPDKAHYQAIRAYLL